jgi:eukaryotic-like serine/threonine-protein kinase
VAEQGVVAGGRFRLVRPIGDGGMGSVWQAHDETLGRPVAVKIVPARREEELYARFRREARIIRQFSHRNIVGVLDAGEIVGEGLLFMAMELLHGSPLSNHLRGGEPLPPTEILPVLIEVCRGLETAHAAGVIHRDIKPENIFLAIVPGEGVVPKILDFGLSTAEGRLTQTRITADGQVLGTPMYMSPEQAAASADLTPSTDVWSMGVILYEAVSGKLPFYGTNVTALLDAIVRGEPAPVPAEVDPHTCAILRRCLQKNAGLRYADAAALRVDMERALAALHKARARASMPEPPDDRVPGTLRDPDRIAAEPPVTRPSRMQQHALGRAGSPLLVGLLAVGLCAAAVYSVPRRHEMPAARSGLGRIVLDRALRVHADR